MDWLQKKGNTLRLCGRGYSAYMEGHSDYMEGGSGLQPHLSYFPVISAKTSEVNELPIKTQVTSAHKEPRSHLPSYSVASRDVTQLFHSDGCHAAQQEIKSPVTSAQTGSSFPLLLPSILPSLPSFSSLLSRVRCGLT